MQGRMRVVTGLASQTVAFSSTHVILGLLLPRPTLTAVSIRTCQCLASQEVQVVE